MYIKINNKKINIIDANSFSKRLFGLIVKKNITYGMLFKRCNSIHTFFMKDKIDVIGLDKNSLIIYKYQNLNKNRIIRIKNKLEDTSILELPCNSTNILDIGDKIEFYQ